MKIYARIENAVIVELFSTDEAIEDMFHSTLKWIDISLILPAPDLGWVLSSDETTFFPPAAPSFVQKKQRLLSLVAAERFKRWRSGFPVLVVGATKWFHSDEFSLTQQLGLKDKARDLLAAGGTITDVLTIGGQPVIWSTMDGSNVTITAQIAFDIVYAAGIHQAEIFAASFTHISSINSASDLTNYDVTSGWPEVFAEPV